jgi:hypothetical protein
VTRRRAPPQGANCGANVFNSERVDHVLGRFHSMGAESSLEPPPNVDSGLSLKLTLTFRRQCGNQRRWHRDMRHNVP